MKRSKDAINPVTEYFSTLVNSPFMDVNGPPSIDTSVEKIIVNNNLNSLEKWMKKMDRHDDHGYESVNLYHALWLSLYYNNSRLYREINDFMKSFSEPYIDFYNDDIGKQELLLIYKNSNIPFQAFINLHDYIIDELDDEDICDPEEMVDQLFSDLFHEPSFVISWCEERYLPELNSFDSSTDITTILNTFYYWYYKNFFLNLKSLIKNKRDNILLKERIERCTKEYEQVFNMIKLPRDIFDHIVSFIH